MLERSVTELISDLIQPITFIYLTFIYISSTQAQFKDHIDFQKISEINFRNEKYNVLKPTIHEIKDHFKDFIQKRNNIQSEKIYMDKNGLRHYWYGMELPGPRSLRKSDLNTNGANTTTNNPLPEKPKAKPRRKKRIEKEYVPPKPNVREGSVAVRTTFYCPFLGVMRMTSHVKDYEEIKEFV